jgi:lipopolysaccharide export system protein LptA
MPPVKLLGLLVIYLFSVSALAVTGDREQPIKIEADKLEIDENRHISIYQGNVDMHQGSLHIQADKITLHFDPQNNLEWLEINGNPARFDQLNDQQQPINGSAINIHYFDQQSVIKLMGKARFQNNKDIIESEIITVNTETNALQAGDTNGKERVRMLIQPNKP